jgi:hypothetical protein
MGPITNQDLKKVLQMLCCLERRISRIEPGPGEVPGNVLALQSTWDFSQAAGPLPLTPAPPPNLAPNGILLYLAVTVLTPFDGTPDLTAGTTAAPTAISPGGEVNWALPATYVLEGYIPVTAAATPLVTWTPGGATQGTARLVYLVGLPST